MLTIGAMRVFRFLKIWQRQHERDRVILAREEFSLRAVCEEVHRPSNRFAEHFSHIGAQSGVGHRPAQGPPTPQIGSQRPLY